MKKILLSLGTLAAVAVPVTTIVACGSKTPTPTTGGAGEEGGAGDKGGQTEGGKAIDNLIATYDGQSAYGSFVLTDEFISDRLFNSMKTGIAKNMTRSNWYHDHNALFYHESLKDSSAENQKKIDKIKTGNVKTFKIKKKDINEKANYFEDEMDEINKKLDSTKQYIYSVKETKSDRTINKENNKYQDGEYEVSIWETKPTTELDDAIKTFNDNFAISEQCIKEIQGTYLFSQAHIFSLGNSTFGLESMKSSEKGTYHDRAVNDNLIDWTGLAPKAALTQPQKDTLKGVTVMAKVIPDNKTGEQNVQLTLNKGGITKTIYVKTKKICELNEEKTFDDDSFAKAWKEKLQFKPIYKLITKLRDQVQGDGTTKNKGIVDLGTNGLYDHFMRIASSINLLASTYDFSKTSDFIKAFGQYLESESDFNEKAMLHAVNNVDYKEFDDIPTCGAKGYLGIYWMVRTYEKFEKFIKDSQASHPEWKIVKINSVEELNTIIIKETQKQKNFEAAKVFLAAHKPAIDFANQSIDDVIALAEKTKRDDYKDAVNALDSKVTALKTKLESLSDDPISSRNKPSLRTQELLEFISNNWEVLFGTNVSPVEISKYLAGFSGASSFNNIKGAWSSASGHLKGGHIQDMVNAIKGAVGHGFTQKQYDKLATAVFAPLGLNA